MKYLDLCGIWQLRRQGATVAIPATVPGCVHTDLLAAEKIADPYYRDHEAQQMWVGETDWVYTRTFQVAPELLECERVLLRCEGLDTLVTIVINGEEIGKTDNQFRTWEFDVRPHLHLGKNAIEITFASPIPVIQAAQQERYLNLTGVGLSHQGLKAERPHRIDGSNRVRKSQCNFGWDWGPMCVTAGVWRPIALLGVKTGRILDVYITQDHTQPGQVGLNVALEIEHAEQTALSASISVSYDGEPVGQTEVTVQNTKATAALIIENPQLWWPNDLGDQPLYNVQIELRDQYGVLDSVAKRIGLRTLTLDRHSDEWGESFQFVVNGVPFFAKGVNWIPADTFVTRVSREWYEYLIKSAADAHCNMLRVWGGGIYEDDAFYEFCDQYGICVWQDFMFACSAYPAFDQAFVDNVKHEAEDNVKRLRHHPCIALWCGNNEIEQIGELLLGDPAEGKMTWDEYKTLFDDLLPGIVCQYDPERPYWPSSPHSPVGDREDWNNPTCGDAHLWSVWHGRQPFEWYRTCEHRFNSEFGFQSFPEPEVVHSYTAPADRNITSYIMEWHQRSQIGNDAIIQYMLSWFQLPTSFDRLLWLSQILQGMAMKYAVEHWRRSMPRGMGTLYWQLNDCWPVASWSSIDHPGNWKALHYMARDFYAPLLVSAVEDNTQGTVEVYAISDLVEATSATMHWTLSDTTSAILAENTLDCSSLSPQANTKICTLELADHLAEYGERRLLVWLELLVAGRVVSQNLVYFTRPKHLELRNPGLTARVQARQHGDFEVTLDAQHPALWVWPDLPGIDATYSHRFFHLFPGKPVTLTVHPERRLSPADFEANLKLYSVIDTWAQD
jgi:beta-mannosidase